MHYVGSLIKHKASKLTDRSNEVQTKRKSHCFQTGLLINMEILTYSSRVLSIFRLQFGSGQEETRSKDIACMDKEDSRRTTE